MEWIWIWDQQAADIVDNRQMSLIKNVCIITQSVTKKYKFQTMEHETLYRAQNKTKKKAQKC